MAVATYGSENYYSVISNRRGALQRPLQVALIAGDFVAVLLSYFVASGLYRVLVIEQDSSVGAGLVVGAVFVTIAYFQGVYDHHRLLNTVWQLRKALAVWLISLTILAVEAFLLKSSADLSRGTTLLFAATGGVALGGLRVLWRLALTSSYAKGRLVDRKVVLLSLKPLDFTSTRFKDLRKHGFNVVRHFVLDPSEEGAAPLLGVNGLVFIGHGRSDAIAIKNAVRVAKNAAEAKVLDAMKSAIEESLKK